MDSELQKAQGIIRPEVVSTNNFEPWLVLASGYFAMIPASGSHRQLPRSRETDRIITKPISPLHVDMSKLFPGKKPKKPSKLPTNLLLGITTNIAVGPLGFRAVVDTMPKGEQNHSYHEMTEADLILLRS